MDAHYALSLIHFHFELEFRHLICAGSHFENQILYDRPPSVYCYRKGRRATFSCLMWSRSAEATCAALADHLCYCSAYCIVRYSASESLPMMHTIFAPRQVLYC